MPLAADNVLRRLKQETRIQHERAERHRLPQALRTGRLPGKVYTDWLAQRFLVHSAVEKEASRLADRDPVLCRVKEHQCDALAKLRADLTFFNVNPDTIRPARAGAKLIASIEQTARFSPIALLGICYVLHATRDGLHRSAQESRGAHGPELGPGTLYLGSGCRHFHAGPCALKVADDTDLVSRLEAHTLVATARMTYVLLVELEDDLFSRAEAEGRDGAYAGRVRQPRASRPASLVIGKVT